MESWMSYGEMVKWEIYDDSNQYINALNAQNAQIMSWYSWLMFSRV